MKKKLIALAVTVAMVFSVMPGFAATASAAEAGEVTVTVGASSVNEEETFDFVKQKITVSGDTAESYGYEDNGDVSKVTALDVFAAVHRAKYGKAFNKNTAKGYLDVPGGWIKKIFVRETMNVSYFVNRAMTDTTASETVLNDGDMIDIFGLQDTYYHGDYFSYFDEDAKTVTAGKEFSLTLMGAMCWNPEYAPIGNENGGTIKLATVAANGELTALDAEPDANGVCTFKFDKPGTYYVSAMGKTYYEDIDQLEPISLPFCKVTVKAATSTPVAADTQMLNANVAAGATSMKLSWNKIKGADGYYIYGAQCGSTPKKLKSVKGTTWTQKNLKNGKVYKYQVKAYKKTSNGTKVLKSSVQAHVATLGCKTTNAKKVNTNFVKAALSKGKTKQIKATIIKQDAKKALVKHVSKFRYKTSNKKVATVSKNGNIKAIGKGTCNVYVYANNGAYKKLTINVK